MRIFKEVQVNNVSDFIKTMETFSPDKHVYRGQPNMTILPAAFRPNEIKKMNNEFPGKKTEYWLSSPQARIPLALIEQELQNRIIAVLSFVCQYNYYLSLCVKYNPHKFQHAIIEEYNRNEGRCWSDEKAFESLLNQHSQTLIGKMKLDGTIINYSTYRDPLEYTSPYLPQHYDVKTAALDWTRNYNNALHFALNSDKPCIFACDKSTNNGLPIRFVEQDDAAVINERMIKQDGLFMQIHDQTAIIFYLLNGRWPTIDDYIWNGGSKLKITKVIIDAAQRDAFREYLDLKGINDQSLGLVPRLEVA